MTDHDGVGIRLVQKAGDGLLRANQLAAVVAFWEVTGGKRRGARVSVRRPHGNAAGKPHVGLQTGTLQPSPGIRQHEAVGL